MEAITVWPDQSGVQINSNGIYHPDAYSVSYLPNLTGHIVFRQESPKDLVNISIELSGLPPGLHGFHVHEKGLEVLSTMPQMENICNALGGHFNPTGSAHGSPLNWWNMERHVGDLCNNILVDERGVCSLNFYDTLVSLDPNSPNCILNKSIVIHHGTDDLGRMGTTTPMPFITDMGYFGGGGAIEYYSDKAKIEESRKTGNAGGRLACGLING
jgi:Cu-Zn family superoxide dismutase